MCFLKKFEKVSAVPLSKSPVIDDTDAYSSDDSVFVQKNDNLFLSQLEMPIKPQKQSNHGMLMNLVSLLNYNSVLMSSLQKVLKYLNQKINQNNETLEDLSEEMSQKKQEIHEVTSIEQIQSEQNLQSGNVGHFSQEGLTQKLFGKKSYKYRLRLVDQIPSIIYKQRNLSFGVQLTTHDGQVIRNSNMIHLCMGVSDSNGEWISQTRAGQAFMKGKTETQLYHGEGNYSKVYPRDVSRNYESGKVNFVIYPKPSMLYYSGNNSSLESKVNFDEIQPLMIKDLTIRAKKKD